MVYKEYTNKRQHDGTWIATVYEYADSTMRGHALRSYTEEISEPDPVLPDTKKFDTGYVHLQFDISTQEYKDFCADPRTSEFLNNQTVEMSYAGLQFRKNLIDVLEAENVLTTATADKITTLIDSWASEVNNPSS